MNPHRRRKKRPSYGVRTIEIVRGRNGFGFTISGQAPCILSCIVNGSPAERAGLRPGDYLIAVNSQNVSKAPHDDVVRMIGSCQGLLKLQIAENYYSNSSDDEITPTTRPRPKYPHRFRQRQQQSHGPTGGHSHHQLPYSSTGAFRNVGIATPQSKYIQPADHHDYKNISDIHMQQNCKTFQEKGEVAPKSKNYLQPAPSKYSDLCGTCNITATGNRSKLVQVRGGGPAGVGGGDKKCVVEPGWIVASVSEKENHPLFNENVVNSIVYPSLQHLQCNADTEEPIYRAVVGYLGTIEMPKEPQLPSHRLSAIRNCIRRLRVEKKVHTLVLLKVFEDRVTLTNSHGATMAEYPTERITFCGAYTDDKKFFGLVTTRAEVAEVAYEETVLSSSSCHVFMVDPKLLQHEEHTKRAKSFRIECVPDMGSGRGECCEFPESVDPILLAIIGLYRGPGGLQMDLDANVSPQPSNTSSNSDSGIGFRDEGQQSDRVSIVDLDNDYGYLFSLPPRHDPELVPAWKPGTSQPHLSEQEHVRTTARGSRDRPLPVQDEGAVTGDRLTVRAMPDPVGFQKVDTSFNTEIMDHQQEPSNIRKCVPKYLLRNAGHYYCVHHNSTSFIHEPVMLQVMDHNGSMVMTSTIRSESPDAVSIKLSPKVFNNPSSGGSGLHVDSQGHSLLTLDKPEEFLVESTSCDPEGSRDIHPSTQEEDTDDTSTKENDASVMQHGCGRRSFRSSSFRKHKFPFGRSKKQQEETPYSDGEIIDKTSGGGGSMVGLNGCGDAGDRRRSMMVDVGRVGSWAVSFEKLLADPAGIHTFAEFLKKEFSFENISFWVACERYRRFTDLAKLKTVAKEIYQKYLAEGSAEPINVDGHARQLVESKLESPNMDLFLLPQRQIFDLMKFDCYSRFLKSSVYQECILKEVAGEPLPYLGDNNLNPESLASPNLNETREIEKNKENEDRRRKSLLPWHRSKSGKPKKDRGTVKQAERKDDFGPSLSDLNGSRSSVASSDIPAVSRQHSSTSESLGAMSGEQQDAAYLCRVHFPDHSSTVVSVKSGESILMCINRVLSRRGLSYSAYDLCHMATDTIMNLEKDSSVLGGKEFRVEERALFHVELPSKKVITVKIKPALPMVDALRPILAKYGILVDNAVVCMNGSDNRVDVNQMVAVFDKCQLRIQKNKDIGAQLFGVSKQHTSGDTNRGNGKLHHHNGCLDMSDGCPSNFKKILPHSKISGSSGKPPVRSRPPLPHKKDSEDMFDLWKRAQQNRLDDQRGTEINYELPDFLKTQPQPCYPHGRASEPICISRSRAGGHVPGKLSRLSSEVFQSSLCRGNPCDDSLLRDGIVPTNSQAEEYFSSYFRGLGENRCSDGPRSLQDLGFFSASQNEDGCRPPVLRPSSHPATLVSFWCRRQNNLSPVAGEMDASRKDPAVAVDGAISAVNRSLSPSMVPPPADTSVSSIHGDMADYLPPTPLRPTLDKFPVAPHVPLHLPEDPPPLPPKPRPLSYHHRPVPLSHVVHGAVNNNSDEDKCALMMQNYSVEAPMAISGHSRQFHGTHLESYNSDRFTVSFV